MKKAKQKGFGNVDPFKNFNPQTTRSLKKDIGLVKASYPQFVDFSDKEMIQLVAKIYTLLLVPNAPPSFEIGAVFNFDDRKWTLCQNKDLSSPTFEVMGEIAKEYKISNYLTAVFPRDFLETLS